MSGDKVLRVLVVKLVLGRKHSPGLARPLSAHRKLVGEHSDRTRMSRRVALVTDRVAGYSADAR